VFQIYCMFFVSVVQMGIDVCCRVWNIEKREARFVEVKGPGDSLSETQKVNPISSLTP